MKSATTAERCAFALVAVGVATVWSGVACLAVSFIWADAAASRHARA